MPANDTMLVYQAYNTISGKFYVGKTTKTLEGRIRQHYNDTNIERMTYFHKALRKYPPETFQWVVLGTANTLGELNQLERHWISLLKECGHPLYNMRDGGDGGSRPGKDNHRYGKSVPANQRDKISNALKAYYATRPGPMTGRVGELSPQFGKPRTDEEKRRISQSKKGKSRPDMIGAFNPSAVAIFCETTGEAFETATAAAEKYSSDLSSIIKCCRGKVNSVRGKVYRYA